MFHRKPRRWNQMVQMKDGDCVSIQRNISYLTILGKVSAHRSLGSWVKPSGSQGEVAASSKPDTGKPPAALQLWHPQNAPTVPMLHLAPTPTWDCRQSLAGELWLPVPPTGTYHCGNGEIIRQEGWQEEMKEWDKRAGVKGQSVKEKQRPEHRARAFY